MLVFDRNNMVRKDTVRKIVEQEKKMEIGVIELEAITDNAGAIALYHKVGFVDIGIYKNYFNVNGMFKDAVVMQKLL